MITFIYVIEKGILEKQTILSIKSLRTFGGDLKNSPVKCFCPRPNKNLSPNTKMILKTLSAELINDKINSKYTYYPLANKPLVCSHSTEFTNTPHVAFVDSDTIFLNEPNLLTINSHPIKIGPPVSQNVGTTGKGDKNYNYWNSLLKRYSIDDDFIKSTPLSSNKKIIGYWNTGVMSLNDKNFFKEWKDTFTDMLDNGLTPPNGIYMTEQVSLAITIHRLKASVYELPHAYNYHTTGQNIVKPEHLLQTIDDMVIMHYHHALRRSHFINPIGRFLQKTSQSEWIINNLKTLALYPLPIKKRIWHLSSDIYHSIKRLTK